jgi:hypothetical protein
LELACFALVAVMQAVVMILIKEEIIVVISAGWARFTCRLGKQIGVFAFFAD